MMKSAAVKKKVFSLAITAVMSALLCVISPFFLPVFTLPVTLSLFAVVCVSAVSELKGVISVVIYILMGAMGLPVFAGFTGGAGVLLGATGGFIAGYIPVALSLGICSKKTDNIIYWILSAFSGVILCYALGTAWYSHITEVTFWQSLKVCVFPFVILDIIKIILGVLLGKRIKLLIKNRL